MADRTVSVALIAKVQGYVAGVGTAVRATKQFGGEVERLGQKSPKQFNDIVQAAGGAGLAMMAVAGFAVKTAATFEKQMSHVSAVANASASDLGKLRQAALQAGKDTVFSATEAARAEEELAKAGISVKDILGGALTGALSLASAGTLDLAEAADIAAKAMNTFSLEGEDVQHIADVLSAAANKSATDVHELGEALKMGGLAARNSGMTLEETTGILAAFADRALVGSDAGTSLKTMLQFLANPTDKAANLMQELGIKVYDAAGNFVGISKVAGILQEKLGTLTQEQRNQALATIFGSDATRAATVLYELGTKGVDQYVRAVDDAGAAQRTAAEKTNNLAGDVERLKGAFETLAIEAGTGTNSALRTVVQTADALVTKFAELPSGLQNAITLLAAIGGSGLLATAGLLKARQVTQEAVQALSDMGPAGEKAAGALGKVGSIAGKAALWGVALIAAYEGAKLFIGFLNSDVEPARVDIDKMTLSLKELADTGKATGELQKAFGANLEKLSGEYGKFVEATGELNRGLKNTENGLADLGRGMVETQEEMSGLNDKAQKTVNQFKENINGVDKALAELVRAGGVTQAKLAFEQLAAVWVAGGRDINELIVLLPQYTTAASGAAQASTGAGKGFGDAAANARTLRNSLQEAFEAGQSLIDVFEQLNGAALNVSDAQIAAENATRDLREALEESNGSLDITTEKGGAARSALNDLARKAAEAAQAVYEQTGSAEAASTEFQKYRQKMIDAAVAAGMARSEAEKLANELFQLPRAIPININVTTNYRTNGTPSRGNSRYPGINTAHGGVIDSYADGGMREDHRAQIVPAGTWRTFAEDETGGEGYIPLGAAKRQQALGVLNAINRRFGNPLGGGGMPNELVLHATFIDPMDGNTIRKQVIRWSLNNGRDPATAFTRA